MKFLGVPSSGSLAGTTYSHNRAGQYQRNRRAPVQPIGTGRRAAIKAAFGAASSGWAALTASQQNSWIAYAAEYPITDALGQSITLTGQQMYVAIGVQARNCLQPLPTAIPATNAVWTPLNLTFAPNETTTPVFTPTFTAGPAGSYLLIGVSRLVSAGVNFNATWWQIDVAAATITTVALLTAYTAQFGPLITGKKMFMKLTPVNAGFVTGVPVVLQAIVT
jgi:hypothetical protein